MGVSAIEWTDYTFNPWRGCTKVSPGCDHCYAERDKSCKFHGVKWGPNAERRIKAESGWAEPLRWNRKAERDGVRRRVLCGSLMDFFERSEHEPSARAQQAAALRTRDLWGQTPWLDWQILTKRIVAASSWLATYGPLPQNVWLGVTVEHPDYLSRLDTLMQIPAAVHFVSFEPLLGAVDLRPWLPGWNVCKHCGWVGRDNDDPLLGPAFPCPKCDWDTRAVPIDESLDWAIVGGETGPGARPMHPDWVRSIRDQCVAAGVPLFFKGWGDWRPPVDGEDYNTAFGRAGKPPAFLVDRDGTVNCFYPHDDGGLTPEECRCQPMLRVGKKRSGRQLDGRVWKQFPEAANAAGGA